MTKILVFLNELVWGAPALVLILGVGLYLSVRTGFVQLRMFGRALRLVIRGKENRQQGTGEASPLRSLCVALAATVGTGNLAGVAGAIALGGPGAIFWIWISGILGMVTKCAEATLAIRCRVKVKDGFAGGPMYMIRQSMPPKWHFLGAIYSFFGLAASFGVGNATQVDTVLTGIEDVLAAFGNQESSNRRVVIGMALAALVFLLLRGGAGRIGRTAEKLVPFAAGGYILLCLGVLIMRAKMLLPAFQMILYGAFSPRAVTGGALGSAFLALRVGISRGVFTNEAGMGTASIAHSGANVSHPVQQGLLGVLEVFLDTIVICTLTALVILCSGVEIPYSLDEGFALTGRAFAAVYGEWVSVPLAIFLVCFALATILGWGLYGARCGEYLLGRSIWLPFAILQAVAVLLTAAGGTSAVWLLSEILNGLMAIPNLIILAWLSPEFFRLIKEYTLIPDGMAVNGGTYENINQCKPLRTLAHAKVPPLRSGGGASGKDNLPSEYRSA